MKEKMLAATTQKSYYGKAKIREFEDGTIVLVSYDTEVCGIKDGKFFRIWGGYSRTTANHINDFRRLFGLEPINKKEWVSMPSGSPEKWQAFIFSIMTGKGRAIGPVFDNFEDAENYRYNIQHSQFFYTETLEVGNV